MKRDISGSAAWQKNFSKACINDEISAF